MPSMEQVERLRAYSDISIEEARNILIEAGDDLLEAVVLLEKRGKIKPPVGEAKKPEPTPVSEQAGTNYQQRTEPSGENFSNMMSRFFKFVGRLIHKGMVNKLEVRRHGEQILSLPIIVLVLLALMPICWGVFLLLIVGLFFDYRYSFRGPNMGNGVNKVMDSAAETAQTIKRDIKESKDTHDERDHSDR